MSGSDAPLQDRIAARQFDDPKVRAVLDEQSIDALELRLGPPVRKVIHAKGGGSWAPGDGRPQLADDDPVVMQRIGICMASRVRRRLSVPIDVDRIHPQDCDWCGYPDAWLLEALDWAVFRSQYVVSEVIFWRQGEDGDERWVTYERAGRHGVYENPRWAAWFDLPRQERRERLAQGSLALGASA